jgi:nucleoside-triphosphatase THEP1
MRVKISNTDKNGKPVYITLRSSKGSPFVHVLYRGAGKWAVVREANWQQIGENTFDDKRDAINFATSMAPQSPIIVHIEDGTRDIQATNSLSKRKTAKRHVAVRGNRRTASMSVTNNNKTRISF